MWLFQEFHVDAGTCVPWHSKGDTSLPRCHNLVFFQNEEIFVQLDELDQLDRITHA